jgi:hypothetical protein
MSLKIIEIRRKRHANDLNECQDAGIVFTAIGWIMAQRVVQLKCATFFIIKL